MQFPKSVPVGALASTSSLLQTCFVQELEVACQKRAGTSGLQEMARRDKRSLEKAALQRWLVCGTWQQKVGISPSVPLSRGEQDSTIRSCLGKEQYVLLLQPQPAYGEQGSAVAGPLGISAAAGRGRANVGHRNKREESDVRSGTCMVLCFEKSKAAKKKGWVQICIFLLGSRQCARELAPKHSSAGNVTANVQSLPCLAPEPCTRSQGWPESTASPALLSCSLVYK